MSNAKVVRNKPVEVKLGDETYKIRFTLNSFIELEDMYGSIDEAMEKLQGKPVIDKETGEVVMEKDPDDETKLIPKKIPNFKIMRDILWAGFVPDQPEMAKEDVGNLLTMENMAVVLPKMNEALKNSFPEKVEENGGAELKN